MPVCRDNIGANTRRPVANSCSERSRSISSQDTEFRPGGGRKSTEWRTLSRGVPILRDGWALYGPQKRPWKVGMNARQAWLLRISPVKPRISMPTTAAGSRASDCRGSSSSGLANCYKAKFMRMTPLEPFPARQGGRLADPFRHLLLVELAFVDVNPARVLVLARAGWDGTE